MRSCERSIQAGSTPPLRSGHANAHQIEGLASGYGTSEVISDVSFTLAKSEVLAIVGKNGIGKTSPLKAALGFFRRGAVPSRSPEKT
jgi:ABC-type branched-subunit amino acid transport system ATPase component